MTVTLNKKEILDRAYRHMKEYADADYEMGEAQNFIRDLCHVFGFSHRRMVSFEQRVKKLDGKRGRMDGFYPGKLLIEMKSRGADLDDAYTQATGYLPGLSTAELPAYILVSDFEHMHLYQRDGKTPPLKHKLSDFAQHLDAYLFLAGFETQAQAEQMAVNEDAARKIAALHDAMRQGDYNGPDLERYMVRLLFCLFADDTGIFEVNGAFATYIRQHTQPDGSDLDGKLQNLFDTLNRPETKRPKSLPPELQDFPYINGSVFQGQLERCYFDGPTRTLLLSCAEDFDWSQISPAIFGSLFQAVIHHDDEGLKAKSSKRRELGAHYTSETNILRVIRPLFLDALDTELKTAQRSEKALDAFLDKLRKLMFLDPACGCGNFLVIAYREIRRLELEAVEARLRLQQKKRTVSATLDAKQFEHIRCDVHQFHGIEIEPSAAHIATVALWLTDHQENQRASLALGGNFNRLPLDKKANIVCANALTTDWASVLPPALCDYVIGNPPFVGAKFMSDAQRADVARAFGTVPNAGLLDFVAAWYVKAVPYIKAHPACRVAFVSTNSITQGEQVGVLWSWMLAQGVRIQFAHRTFQWSNDAKGVAAVHCVIVGFGLKDLPGKTIYQYDDIKAEPLAVAAKNINPYLVDAPDIMAAARMVPLSQVPAIANGSIPADGGNLILTKEERDELIKNESNSAKWIRPYLGAEGFIHNDVRYCLWLADAPPQTISALPRVKARVKAVAEMRSKSTKSATRIKAASAHLFTENRQPLKGRYLAIPRTSSENRAYLPIGYLDAEVIAANDLQIIPDAELYHFGVLSSLMHRAWAGITSGRLKSDIRYSVKLTYNTLPWPLSATNEEKHRSAVEIAAQEVLDARAENLGSSLADLYAPGQMPEKLRKAHQRLDKAVDAAYGYKGGPDDTARVAFLFGLYQQLTSATAPLAEPRKPARKISKNP